MILWSICTAEAKPGFDAICESRGWGPNNFSARITSDGENITHYGLHATMSEENMAWLQDAVAADPEAAAQLIFLFHTAKPEQSFWDWAADLGLSSYVEEIGL